MLRGPWGGGGGRGQARGWRVAQATLQRQGQGCRMRNLEFLCRGGESGGRGQSYRTCLEMTFVEQAHWCALRMSTCSFSRGIRAACGGRGHQSSPLPGSPLSLAQGGKGEGRWKRKVLL